MSCDMPIGRHKTVRRKWSDEERANLRLWRVDGGFTFAEIAGRLGRSESSVKSQAEILGMVINPLMSSYKDDLWQPCEIEYLRENYYRLSLKAMAKALGRTPNAILNKRRKLGMERKAR